MSNRSLLSVNPLVSIIIPVHGDYGTDLGDALKSALYQSYRPIEIIVVNNGGPPILGISKCKELKIINLTENLGASGGRNAGIIASKGHYIALLDHDDLWKPDKLKTQMEWLLQLRGLGLVFSDAECIYGGKVRFRYFQKFKPYKGWVYDKLLKQNFIPCSSVIFPKRIFDEFDGFRLSFPYAQDHELFLRIAKEYPIDYIDRPLMQYRMRQKNMVSAHIDYNEDRLRILRMHNGSKLEMAKRHGILAATYLKNVFLGNS